VLFLSFIALYEHYGSTRYFFRVIFFQSDIFFRVIFYNLFSFNWVANPRHIRCHLFLICLVASLIMWCGSDTRDRYFFMIWKILSLKSICFSALSFPLLLFMNTMVQRDIFSTRYFFVWLHHSSRDVAQTLVIDIFSWSGKFYHWNLSVSVLFLFLCCCLWTLWFNEIFFQRDIFSEWYF